MPICGRDCFDSTLLVVREGVASAKALKKGLAAIDAPNVGVVVSDAADFDQEELLLYDPVPPKQLGSLDS
jgi:hypothetical protein